MCPEGTAALTKSVLTWAFRCRCCYLGDGPAGCAASLHAGSHTCTSLGTPFTQQNRGLREAGAVAWGHAARKWQSEEPTARFVPPCVLGPVRVPVR